jgi:hypothetical protein
MDGNMAISEDIKWIESILQNKCVHKYGKDVPPQIVGFYRSEHSYSEIK